MVKIRREQHGDKAQIRLVHTRAFGQLAEADIVDTLRTTCPEGISFVAVCRAYFENRRKASPMHVIKDWSPEAYLKFGNERTQPSIDLVNRISIDYQPQTLLDIGCGPGNSSKVLMQRWPNAKLVGIDSSPKMIERAKQDYPQAEWIVADALTFSPELRFDLVFSNATIQWIPNHERLLARFCELLSERGVVAIQLPLFNDMPLGKAIERVAQRDRWQKQTAHCADLFTYHDYGFYYDTLARHVRQIELWETSYLHVLASQAAIIEWIKSTGMKPYLDSLESDAARADFERDLLAEVERDYPLQSDGKVLFPFKRLFMIGYKRR